MLTWNVPHLQDAAKTKSDSRTLETAYAAKDSAQTRKERIYTRTKEGEEQKP